MRGARPLYQPVVLCGRCAGYMYTAWVSHLRTLLTYLDGPFKCPCNLLPVMAQLVEHAPVAPGTQAGKVDEAGRPVNGHGDGIYVAHDGVAVAESGQERRVKRGGVRGSSHICGHDVL